MCEEEEANGWGWENVLRMMVDTFKARTVDDIPVPAERHGPEGVRVLQHRSGWALQAALRLRKIPHTVETVKFARLGTTQGVKELPQLMDGSYIVATEDKALRHCEHFYPLGVFSLGLGASSDMGLLLKESLPGLLTTAAQLNALGISMLWNWTGKASEQLDIEVCVLACLTQQTLYLPFTPVLMFSFLRDRRSVSTATWIGCVQEYFRRGKAMASLETL